MITAVDTNILLDILLKDPEFWKKSAELIDEHSAVGSLLISQAVYTELLAFFLGNKQFKEPVSELDRFLRDFRIQVSGFSKEDLVLAAETWQKVSKADKVACPKCGALNSFSCRKCNAPILWRNHIITDFLIGAHAKNNADVMLTRDRGYYKRYFTINLLP